MSVIESPEDLPLGTSLPPGDPHGVSVHLPKWADTVGWACREPRVLGSMTTGYPRFFVARVVDKLAMMLLEVKQFREGSNVRSTDGTGARLAMVLDTLRHGQMCRTTLLKWCAAADPSSVPDIEVGIVSWDGKIAHAGRDICSKSALSAGSTGDEDIILVSYPAELASQAKAFWQHTGFGISSRRAIHWIEDAPFLSPSTPPKRNLLPFDVSHRLDEAKATLRSRIAAGQSTPTLPVSPSDVFLFPTGMTALSEVASSILSLRNATHSNPYRAVIFGFPYVDTYKLLTLLHPFHATLYPATPHSLSSLTTLLSTTPIDALFTEFPGNPLLQSPPLLSLHTLAQQHNFLLVVDDTIGTSTNLALLGACDVVCTSLTKMFSGGCNVMGGAVVVNPTSRFRAGVEAGLEKGREEAERAWFWRDVLVMEGNSRDFEERVLKASENAELVVGLLRASLVVREVYYPLGAPTQGGYDEFKREGGGYGYMLSVRFWESERAVVFYDSLDVAKGPSLGTNFTLCCAYTLLAHYKELEWAAGYGVVEDLVRISVGLEERGWLQDRVMKALRVAEAVELQNEGNVEGDECG
ncbi:putative cystathionine gamma-synthase/beta-lyase [Staphylotrichum tortipilum]|uniref:Cystathionine gamma-synthase/beta-lyase n=1 Tax=Staphylotrichum tortipilum TaxID=2831512 RepID=A0AAN6MN17_9PEZI|nr:putative cystathionine gamma-synthase/beta-lyase [Staphylotrichum longicolle]